MPAEPAVDELAGIERKLMAQAAAELQRLQLTDEERKAIKTAVGCMVLWITENGLLEDESLRLAVVTLRGLLERSGGAK